MTYIGYFLNVLFIKSCGIKRLPVALFKSPFLKPQPQTGDGSVVAVM